MTTEIKTMTTQEVAERYNVLAQQEQWFEIQDELFAADVRSLLRTGRECEPDPDHSL